MIANSVFAVIVASYVSSEEARSDLSALDDAYYDNRLTAYDSALLVTDAWGQVRVEAHTSRQASDLLMGPMHDAFTVLFGGPFVGGEAPPLPNNRRLPHKELLSIGDAMGPSSVRTVALAMGRKQLNLAQVFRGADAVDMTSVESAAENLSELTSVIADAIRQRRKV